jgi:hypothetical protein
MPAPPGVPTTITSSTWAGSSGRLCSTAAAGAADWPAALAETSSGRSRMA